MGISKNLAFYGLNPSPFSGREGYKEFLEMPLSHILILWLERIANLTKYRLPITEYRLPITIVRV